MVEAENPFAVENRSSSIIKHLNLKSDMIVADIGCGPGRVTLPLSKKLTQGKVVAIDLQQKMLDRIQEKITDQTNIELRQQNITEKPLEKNQFDRIILVNVIGEIPDQKTAITNCYNALKKDGIISFTETVFDPHFQSKKKMTGILQSAGLTNIKTFGPWYSYTIHGRK